MKLEIGPGAGKYRFNPILRGDDVIYLDLTKPYEAHRFTWIIAECCNLPFKEEVFEEIVASHVIEHVSNPLKFLGECHRTLEKGGKLQLYTPNFLSCGAYRDLDHKHIYNFLSLRKLLKTANFEAIYPSLNIGSLFPKSLIRLLKVFLLIISDQLVILGIKN